MSHLNSTYPDIPIYKVDTPYGQMDLKVHSNTHIELDVPQNVRRVYVGQAAYSTLQVNFYLTEEGFSIPLNSRGNPSDTGIHSSHEYTGNKRTDFQPLSTAGDHRVMKALTPIVRTWAESHAFDLDIAAKLGVERALWWLASRIENATKERDEVQTKLDELLAKKAELESDLQAKSKA